MAEYNQEDPQEVHHNQRAPLVAVPKLSNNKVHVIRDWLDQLEYVGSTNGWSSKELYRRAIIATMPRIRDWHACNRNSLPTWETFRDGLLAATQGTSVQEAALAEMESATWDEENDQYFLYFSYIQRLALRGKISSTIAIRHMLRILPEAWRNHLEKIPFLSMEDVLNHVQHLVHKFGNPHENRSLSSRSELQNARLLTAQGRTTRPNQKTETAVPPRSRQATCHSCGKMGHFARQCPQQKVQTRAAQLLEDEKTEWDDVIVALGETNEDVDYEEGGEMEPEDDIAHDEVMDIMGCNKIEVTEDNTQVQSVVGCNSVKTTVIQTQRGPKYMVTALVNGIRRKMLVDSGAQMMVIPRSQLPENCEIGRFSNKVLLQMGNDTLEEAKDCVQLTISIGTVSKTVGAAVIEKGATMLGTDWLHGTQAKLDFETGNLEFPKIGQRVRVAQATVIPPLGITTVKLIADDHGTLSEDVFLVPKDLEG
ncbi:hypothetical protein IWQ61_010568, partial [Dispira simplex]